jgi:hypothetical protein
MPAILTWKLDCLKKPRREHLAVFVLVVAFFFFSIHRPV